MSGLQSLSSLVGCCLLFLFLLCSLLSADACGRRVKPGSARRSRSDAQNPVILVDRTQNAPTRRAFMRSKRSVAYAFVAFISAVTATLPTTGTGLRMGRTAPRVTCVLSLTALTSSAVASPLCVSREGLSANWSPSRVDKNGERAFALPARRGKSTSLDLYSFRRSTFA